MKKEPSTGELPHDYAIVAQMKKRAPKKVEKCLACKQSVSSKIFENPMDIVLASLYFIFFI